MNNYNLSYDEISDGDHFEDLVAAYFEDLKNSSDNKIVDVYVNKSGVGTDGGVDIIIEFLLTDGVKPFSRKWIVQCKFHKESISPSRINSVNIPTLINSHAAHGYLLICRKRPTSKLTKLFDNLNKNCDRKYKYVCWDGNHFLSKVRTRSNILEHYFPNFYAQEKKKR